MLQDVKDLKQDSGEEDARDESDTRYTVLCVTKDHEEDDEEEAIHPKIV